MATQMQALISIGELKEIVSARVREAFPDEDFLDEELTRIVGGFLNGFNWGLIKMASEQGAAKSLEVIETRDHFATPSMGRSDIVQHMMDTTGLSREVVDVGLTEIENLVDLVLRSSPNLRFGWVGYVSRTSESEDGYRISLSDELRV